jgi:hypothetical protein
MGSCRLRKYCGTMTLNVCNVHSYLGRTFNISLDGEVSVSMEGCIKDISRLQGISCYSCYYRLIFCERGFREAALLRPSLLPLSCYETYVLVTARSSRHSYSCVFLVKKMGQNNI